MSSTPPDANLAAGPKHVVVAVNSLLAIYDKSGVQQGGFQDLRGFFLALGVSGEVFDPRVIYDQTDGRFILSAAEVDMSQFTNGHVLIAVSNTSDPTAGWYKFAIDFKGRNGENTADTFPDAPSIGAGPSGIYVTSNQFEFNAQCLSVADGASCAFSDAWVKVIGLPELLAGNPVVHITTFKALRTASDSKAFGLQPALTYGPAPAEFLVAADYAKDPNSALELFSIDTAGNLDATELAVPSFLTPPDAPQAGSSNKIATNDFRMLNAVWATNSLWTGHNVAGHGGATSVARWYQIELSNLSAATLVQSGDVSGAGAAYYPAISVNVDGTAGIVFTTSSATMAASAAFSARAPADVLGSMRLYAIYRSGSGPYDPANENRWGDYSGVSPDPEGSGFWGIVEYASAPDPRFGTAVTRVSVGAVPDFSLSTAQASASVDAGGTATYQLSGTALNGLTTPVAFTCSNLPANASCSFSPAMLTLASVASTSTLRISTSPAAAANLATASIPASRYLSLTAMAAGMVGLVCMLPTPRSRLGGWAALSVGLLMLICVSCGEGGGPSAASLSPLTNAQTTPPGTYSVTINARAGTLLHSVQVTLKVE